MPKRNITENNLFGRNSAWNKNSPFRLKWKGRRLQMNKLKIATTTTETNATSQVLERFWSDLLQQRSGHRKSISSSIQTVSRRKLPSTISWADRFKSSSSSGLFIVSQKKIGRDGVRLRVWSFGCTDAREKKQEKCRKKISLVLLRKYIIWFTFPNTVRF